MKNILISILLFCFLGTAWAQTAEGQEGSVFRIGLSSRSFEKINRNDITAAMKAWINTVIREQNLSLTAEVTLYDSFHDLGNALRQNRLDALVITVEEAMRQGIQPETVFLTQKEEGVYVRYVFIVHRNSGIADIESLKNRKVVMHDNYRMALSRLWIKSLFDGHESNLALTKIDNPSKAILQVFFRQSQAALVTKAAFELACELNPQLRRDLAILSESPPFITSFFMFRSTGKNQARKQMEAALSLLHTTPGGRQVLTVFQSSKIVKQPASVLDDTIRFIQKSGQLDDYYSFQEKQP